MTDFYDRIPYFGTNSLDVIARRGIFTTPISIRLIALRDMSRPQHNTFDDFDELVYNVRTNLFKGDKVHATKVVENKDIVGMVHDINYDYSNRNVRIFVRDDTNDVHEVYPQSICREMTIRESLVSVLTVSQLNEKLEYA